MLGPTVARGWKETKIIEMRLARQVMVDLVSDTDYRTTWGLQNSPTSPSGNWPGPMGFILALPGRALPYYIRIIDNRLFPEEQGGRAISTPGDK